MGGPKYKKFLDKKSLLDQQILEFVKSGELSVGVVWINSVSKGFFDKYSRRSLLGRGRRTS